MEGFVGLPRLRWAQGWYPVQGGYQVAKARIASALRSPNLSLRHKAGMAHLLVWREAFPWLNMQIVIGYWVGGTGCRLGPRERRPAWLRLQRGQPRLLGGWKKEDARAFSRQVTLPRSRPGRRRRSRASTRTYQVRRLKQTAAQGAGWEP